jgi:glycosyltransferase involved in cell wall biosynthesis
VVRRCLVVSYYFPPVGGGGVQRIAKMIKYLSRRGWRFTVITASESAKAQPLDYSLEEDISEKVEVIRLQSLLPHKKNHVLQKLPGINVASYWKRWVSAFCYIPDMRKSWLPQAKAALINEIKTKKYDCLLITSPPYSLAVLAGELQAELDMPVILDMRDPWTTNPYKIHPTKYHLKKDRALEIETISKIKYGISAYYTLLDYYQKHIKDFHLENWHVISNGYDEEDFYELKPNADRKDQFFNIAFSGVFYSHINNPKYLFKAMAQLNIDNPELGKRIRFHHIGKSFINLKALSKKFAVEDQIARWGYVDHKKCLDILTGMDALCFILDDRHINSGKTIGGKVYEYLRLKKPVLALVPEKGEAAGLIEKTKSGQVIAPSRTAKIAQTLNNWVNQYPKFSFTGVENYSRERQAESFLKILNKVSKKIKEN